MATRRAATRQQRPRPGDLHHLRGAAAGVMSGLRLDLIVRREPVDWDTGGEDIRGDRWTWRLWSGSRIVATSGSQRYSRRIDCARGAEVGAGLTGVVDTLKSSTRTKAVRWMANPIMKRAS